MTKKDDRIEKTVNLTFFDNCKRYDEIENDRKLTVNVYIDGSRAVVV